MKYNVRLFELQGKHGVVLQLLKPSSNNNNYNDNEMWSAFISCFLPESCHIQIGCDVPNETSCVQFVSLESLFWGPQRHVDSYRLPSGRPQAWVTAECNTTMLMRSFSARFKVLYHIVATVCKTSKNMVKGRSTVIVQRKT